MKKITILFIVGILIGSTMGAIGTQGKQGTAQSLSEPYQHTIYPKTIREQ